MAIGGELSVCSLRERARMGAVDVLDGGGVDMCGMC